MLGGGIQVGDPSVLAERDDAAGDGAHDRGVDGLERFQPRLAAQQLTAGALELLGEQRGETADQHERGEVRGHDHRELSGRLRSAFEVAGGGQDDPGLHAPRQHAEGDAGCRCSQRCAAAAEADGAADDGERIQDREDALGAARQIHEPGRRDHVRCDLAVRDPSQVPSRAEQERADQRGEVDQGDDGEEQRLDRAGKWIVAERGPGSGPEERGPHREADPREQDQLAVEPALRALAERRIDARFRHGPT